MPKFAITIELGEFLLPGGALTQDAFPALAAAVRRAALFAQDRWQHYAAGAPLPSGMVVRNRTGEYLRSIATRETGPFTMEVFTALPYARGIEDGFPQRDMKRMLDTSFKVRVTKNGKRYLVIPFHHDRYSGLPEAARDWFVGRTPTHITGTFRRQSGTGAYDIRTRKLVTVPGWRYAWGDRLNKRDLAGMDVHGAAAKRLEGLYKFQNPGGAAGGGAPKGSHTQFINFRRMVEGSKGWVAKAQPGKHVARTVAEEVKPLAEEMFRAAVAEDVRTMLGGAA